MSQKAVALSMPDQTQRILGFGLLALALLVMQVVTAAARGAPETFADLVEKVSPAVVNITTMTKVATQIGPQGIVPEGSPFEDLFRDFTDRQGRPRSANALGSGFVISEDGYIVTNNHVIDGADEIMIEFFDGKELPATLVGRDKNVDIALLKVEAGGALPFVDFGDSDVARVGDWVMAMGNPLGQGFSVSAGIISARNRELSGAYDDFIQTDAAINRGNSGGPLFDMDGDVIGVNTAIMSPTGGSIGIGFSMASKVVEPVVKQLKEFGEVRRGWLGVNIGDVTQDMAQALGMDTPAGAIIRDVFDGPAKDAGLLSMDVILMFDGKDVGDAGALVRLVGAAPVGKTVKTVVLRDGKRQTIDVVLGKRPEPEDIASTSEAAPEPTADMVLGMAVGTLNDELREKYKIAKDVDGIVVLSVDADTNAAEKGMQEGDVITDAGQKPVRSVDDFQAQIDATAEAGRQSLLVLVRRDGQPRFVVLNVE
ncbi:MAG: Do family serine endopeptidase [Rhodobacteraceae bacterium]|nr:Do family serine endopeptidase [Paracoccaceae bacterium]